MRKLGLLLLMAGLLMLPALATPAAEEGADVTCMSWQEAARRLDLEKMESFKNRLDQDISGYTNGKSIGEWIKDFMRGEWRLEPGEIARALGRAFVREVAANGSLLGKILILAVISALLINLQSSFNDENVSRIAGLACFLAISALALGSFRLVLDLARSTIDNLSDFMLAVLPQMMVLIAGLGHVQSAAMFPLLMTACGVFADGLDKIVFPLIIFSLILNLLDTLVDTVKVQKLGKLVFTITELVLGLAMMLFVTLLTLKTLYGSILDKFTLKTGRFVTDLFFPVIGGYLSEALETAAGYVVLLKQGVTILGALILFGLVMFPIIKIGVIALIYKVAGALVEPMGDSRTSQVLDLMGNHLFLVMATVTAVGFMFIIMMAIIASTGNSAIIPR